MGGIFGKSKRIASKVTSVDMAVLQLKQQRDKVKQYQRRLETRLDQEKSVAKDLLQKGQKERALNILKKKKLIENYIVNTDSLLEHVENQLHSITFSQVQTKVLESLERSNQALKQLNKILSIDRVGSILDEAREGAEYQKEIDEMIKGTLTDEDETELLEELEKLQSQSVSSKEQPVQRPEEKELLDLPEVPSTQPEPEPEPEPSSRVKKTKKPLEGPLLAS